MGWSLSATGYWDDRKRKHQGVPISISRSSPSSSLTPSFSTSPNVITNLLRIGYPHNHQHHRSAHTLLTNIQKNQNHHYWTTDSRRHHHWKRYSALTTQIHAIGHAESLSSDTVWLLCIKLAQSRASSSGWTLQISLVCHSFLVDILHPTQIDRDCSWWRTTAW